ncbi:MAG: hypothetical protein HY800_01325 [Ignavibacteriales bacterium]|nr:hypothetical protein [Ignavibacteriales bacterium]
MTSENVTGDRLDPFEVYNIACKLFNDFWGDSVILGKDYRGRELVKQLVPGLDYITGALTKTISSFDRKRNQKE